VSEHTVYAGGVFSSIGDQPQSGLAAITEDSTDVVSVPDVPKTTLALRVIPNPSTADGLHVVFTLPYPARASLEVFDISGRLVAGRDLHDLTAGRHAIQPGSR